MQYILLAVPSWRVKQHGLKKKKNHDRPRGLRLNAPTTRVDEVYLSISGSVVCLVSEYNAGLAMVSPAGDGISLSLADANAGSMSMACRES